MKMLSDRIVPDWRNALRWASVQMRAGECALLVSLQTLPWFLPAEVQERIPQPYGLIAAIAWPALGVAARLFKRKCKAPANGE